MKKTFLILDGQSSQFNTGDINEAFANAGIDAEFEAVSDTWVGLDIIRQWKEQGLRLDIITIDIDGQNRNAGIKRLEWMLDEVESMLGSEMLPQKILFHSASPSHQPVETKYGTSPCVFDDIEFAQLEMEQGIFHQPVGFGGNDTRLRKYLNEHWETNFVTSKPEEALDKSTGPLEVYDAVNFLNRGKISAESALSRIVLDLDSLIEPAYPLTDRSPLQMEFYRTVVGSVTGVIAYNPNDVVRLKEANPAEPVILVLKNAKDYQVPPHQIDGLVVLEDDVHAAHIRQVCANMGMPTLIGVCDSYHFANDEMQFGLSREGSSLKAGDGLTLNANYSYGRLYEGKFELTRSEQDRSLQENAKLMALVNQILKEASIEIKANADTRDQVEKALNRGADGIGLVRTEHMFFEVEKRAVLKEYLLSNAPSDGVIASFREMQEVDFIAILEAANTIKKEFPVTIRLLDAPPHEFMNSAEVAAFEARVGKENIRGVQAGLRTERLYEAQISALCIAFEEVKFRHPLTILVPNVISETEMDQVRSIFNQHARSPDITLNPMLEMKPYLEALASSPNMPYAYVSYGTNDLTSEFMGGVRRNDIEQTEAWKNANGVKGVNPFLSLMKPVQDGILSLQTRTDAPKGTICGGQVADDEKSIRWAARNGLSMSVPFSSVPYVKLVAAQELLHRNIA